MHIKYISWENFKNEIDKKHSPQTNHESFYRGHSSSLWELEPTLYRFCNKRKKDISANKYYKVIKEIKEKNLLDGVLSYDLPDESPFLIGLLCGGDDHEKKMQQVFWAMVELRGLGFPSPILDWSKNPYIAAFFAFSGNPSSEVAIYHLKKYRESEWELFSPTFYTIDIPIDHVNRHNQQEAAYTLSVKNIRGVF